MNVHAPVTDSLEFYSRFAKMYDSVASVSPAFPSPDLIHTLMAPHIDCIAEDVLDVGIGTGLSSLPFLKQGFTVTGVDGSAEMLEVCRKKGIAADLVQTDFTQAVLPFSHGEFDAAFCANTLYLMPETVQNRVIGELHRVTKPGGVYAFNYEIRCPGELGVRFNDATTNMRDMRRVETYSVYPEKIRETLARQGSRIVEADVRKVARKRDGFPIVFETIVCRNLA